MTAERLNCQPVGGKRKSKTYDQTWNIKYLPRFSFGATLISLSCSMSPRTMQFWVVDELYMN